MAKYMIETDNPHHAVILQHLQNILNSDVKDAKFWEAATWVQVALIFRVDTDAPIFDYWLRAKAFFPEWLALIEKHNGTPDEEHG